MAVSAEKSEQATQHLRDQEMADDPPSADDRVAGQGPHPSTVLFLRRRRCDILAGIMMIDPSTRVWLVGIRQEIGNVRHYTEDANSGTLAAWPMRKALQHSLTIIAESARQVPAELKAKRPDLPWHRIDALDNLLGHELGREDSGEPWSRISDHLDDLDEMAAALLDHDAAG